MVKPEVREDWLPLRAGSPHRYRFEEPDLFFLGDVGDVSGADMACMFDLVEELAARTGRRLFWISDISRLGRVSEEAAKLSIQRDVKQLLRATILYGGSFRQRLLANMVAKALLVLKPNRSKRPLFFCATEAEARAMVEEMRQEEGSSS
ncbi:hypothetical protein [Polyangium jinanense]|uniref:Uncharacterized protein n=1 Tax=Polyangium jinanense TaxID=2829994 RepID=A0A9X3X2K6_9BACT|nr:hypothetical protein [Polyangium jinanense]MDC3952657.1 hypothetical protein [Polyangium jinanense]MDC3980276.1 hypothetical protein [Polyangium jinanense]